MCVKFLFVEYILRNERDRRFGLILNGEWTGKYVTI